MVVVEADFTAGDDFRFGQERVEFGESRVVGLVRVVRIDAGAGVESRHGWLAVVFAADVECLMHFGWALADADGQDCRDAGGMGALKDRRQVGGVPVAIEVGVGIDEQLSFLSAVGTA